MNGSQESPMLEDALVVNPITLIGQKKCTKCKKIKELSEFCKNKHRKDGLDCWCKSCKKQYCDYHKEESAEYRQTHKKEIVAYNKEYRQAHKAEIAESDKKYRQAHKAKIAEYRQAHKEKIAEYYQIHKQERTIYRKEYLQTETGKNVSRKGSRKRRALKAGAEYEVFDDREIFERDAYRCQNCGRKTRPGYKNPNHPLRPNLDHIIPLSKGGPHTRLNTQCLCHQCNIEKHNTGMGDQLRMF